MSKYYTFNPERSLDDTLPDEISVFWNKGLFDLFSGIDGVNIHYAQFIQDQAECPTIVIVPGRCESYLKYQELSFDLYCQGYNIFIIDHRGQGLSGRMLRNANKGYVVKFQDYVDDFQFFIKNIVTPQSSEKPYLLAHSMGGTIATRFMQDCPNAIKAAVISSPMLGFYSGLLPSHLAKMLVTVKLKFNEMISTVPWYFLGQKDYFAKSFSDNKLTHSIQRYQYFVDLYKRNKIIQLGGVTTHWLAQSIAAQKELFAKIAQLKTPILLLQARADSIVCQQAQDDFCQQLHALQPQSCPGGVPSRIDYAFHELLFETDDLRDQAITQSLAWFTQHN